jgi:hypothetical protein
MDRKASGWVVDPDNEKEAARVSHAHDTVIVATASRFNNLDPTGIVQRLVDLMPGNSPLGVISFDVLDVRGDPYRWPLVQLHKSIYGSALRVYTLTLPLACSVLTDLSDCRRKGAGAKT